MSYESLWATVSFWTLWSGVQDQYVHLFRSTSHWVPHVCFLKATVPAYAAINIWANFLLNNSTHASRSWHSSHHHLAYCPAWLAKQVGLPSTATPIAVPRADNDSDSHGDIVTSAAGLNLASTSYQFVFPTDLITNVTLLHPFDTCHQLNKVSLTDEEAKKNKSYKADYHVLGLAFALQFLWSTSSRSPLVSLAHCW